MSSPFLYRLGAKFARWYLKVGSHDGWRSKLPMDGKAWTDHRDFPLPAAKPFRARWKALKQELDAERRGDK